MKFIMTIRFFCVVFIVFSKFVFSENKIEIEFSDGVVEMSDAGSVRFSEEYPSGEGDCSYFLEMRFKDRANILALKERTEGNIFKETKIKFNGKVILTPINSRVISDGAVVITFPSEEKFESAKQFFLAGRK